MRCYGAELMATLDDTFTPDQIRPTLERAEELELGTADLAAVAVIEMSVWRPAGWHKATADPSRNGMPEVGLFTLTDKLPQRKLSYRLPTKRVAG